MFFIQVFYCAYKLHTHKHNKICNTFERTPQSVSFVVYILPVNATLPLSVLSFFSDIIRITPSQALLFLFLSLLDNTPCSAEFLTYFAVGIILFLMGRTDIYETYSQNMSSMERKKKIERKDCITSCKSLS